MALNYTLHQLNTDETGQAQTLPYLSADPVGQRLALDTASVAIVGPCELHLHPDEDVFLDIRQDASDLDPASSSLKIAAGPREYRLPRGTWYIEATAA